jgi:hypothetical protein
MIDALVSLDASCSCSYSCSVPAMQSDGVLEYCTLSELHPRSGVGSLTSLTERVAFALRKSIRSTNSR